ncbi:MAG: sugar phosphate isomerase/epimerase [Proteobacteria bacterium]|nr:sugar phosphate isomerase/epimerase [Bacteroidota bacterium]MDA0888700.1 sugar phosphate isomerase/epimerase [Bacteroidota bacterium]MDA0995319.1 sugar phosphate isomerase/epimerase [Pseudomonadota bacterium]
MERRNFMSIASKTMLSIPLIGLGSCTNTGKRASKTTASSVKDSNNLFFKLSLAQWSLHRSLFSGKLDHLDFAEKSRSLGFEGVEYVNGFFKDKAKDSSYLNEMKSRADGAGQQNVLIMIDGEGDLAHPDKKTRKQAVENHYKWVEAADFLGCHAIRVNLSGGVNRIEAIDASVASLTSLSGFAKDAGINVLVENHGGFSSNGAWMKDVFSQLNIDNCGTLPDFGNFCITKGKADESGVRPCLDAYDKYKGMEELLPFAKAVSAKSYHFDDQGNETTIDFLRMMKMVKNTAYTGFVGVEYEGKNMSEDAGIKATRDLLIRVGNQLVS